MKTCFNWTLYNRILAIHGYLYFSKIGNFIFHYINLTRWDSENHKSWDILIKSEYYETKLSAIELGHATLEDPSNN